MRPKVQGLAGSIKGPLASYPRVGWRRERKRGEGEQSEQVGLMT